MPNDDQQPKGKSVRTRPANVIRAIVLSAAAAAAPAVLPGCESASDYGVPDVEDTVRQEDTGGDVTGDDAAPTDDGTMDVVPPYGVPDGVDYGVPDGIGPDSVEYYGVPDGTEEAVPAYGLPDGMEEITPDYGVPDSGEEAAPAYGVPGDAGEPEYGLDYGVPKPPAK